MKGSTAKHLAEVQYEQRKAAGILRASDGRLGENCTHVCRPPKKAKATWRCPKCLRHPILGRVNPYRDGRGQRTELAKRLRRNTEAARRAAA